MTERAPEVRSFAASDGYPLHMRSGRHRSSLAGTSWYCTACKVTVGGTTGSGDRCRRPGTQPRFQTAAAQAPTHAIAAILPRRDGSSSTRRNGFKPCAREQPGLPVAVAGISWGGKLAVILAARYPELVDAVALICPGLHPRVGVTPMDRLKIAWAFITNRQEDVSDPVVGPGAVHR